MNEDTTDQTPPQIKSASADLVSLVAALIFAAAGVMVLAGESLAELDPVVLAGIALVAIGLARIVMVPVRATARSRARRAARDDPEDEGEAEADDPGEDSNEDSDEDRVQDQVKD